MARLFLTPGATFGTIGGFADTSVIGTNSNETVFLTADATTDFDPSFNRGGDTINIGGIAELYTASLVGSSLHLTAANGADILVPVGGPTQINFIDAPRTLKLEAGVVYLGNQVITSTPTSLVEGEFVGVFTLTENVVSSDGGTPPTPIYETYWGYNPHDHETGNNNGNEAPTDGGIPLSDLVQFLTTITGLDLTELGLIDDDGVGPFDNVTNLTISGALTLGAEAEADDGGEVEGPLLEISFADGTFSQFNIEAQISEQYFAFLQNLLYDNEGNSRLFQKLVNEDEINAYLEAHPEYEFLQPAVLTPTENNGGTLEAGFTTSADELIVVPRLELLHQAYINGGGGYNTVEIDAKGTYAQPLAMLNIQEVIVNDLPNFYTTDYGSGDGNLGNGLFTGEEDTTPGQDVPSTPFPEPTGDTNSDSWIDLNRAVDLQKLVISGQDQDGVSSGDLTVVGVRNGATLRLEGNFTDGDTTISYGEGVDVNGLYVELAVGTVTQDINILQNSAVIHIESEGISNYLDDFFTGGYLTHMYITGSGAFGVEGDLDASFRDDTPVVIDASGNWGGVDLELTDSQNITIKGSHGNDRFILTTNDDDGGPTNDETVDIDGGAGDNYYQVSGAEVVTITNDDGDNNYEIAASPSSQFGFQLPAVGKLTITTGDGDNKFELEDIATAVITAGDGNNRLEITSRDSGDYTDPGATPDWISNVKVTFGDGNNTIYAQAYSEFLGTNGGEIDIDVGSGINEIAAAGRSVSIDAIGAGPNTIYALGEAIVINNAASTGSVIALGGSGNDFSQVINELGGNDPDGVDHNPDNEPATNTLEPTVFLNVQAGTGATVLLGLEGFEDGVTLTALPGSVISGTDLTLNVRTVADMRAADLNGVTSVILDDDNFTIGNSTSANSAIAGGNAAVLVLTDQQFLEIGAENFSVDGAIFNTHSFVKIIVTESTSLTALGVDDLPRNIDLILEIQDGVTLEMTAQQLHTRVAQEGVLLATDGNTDYANGSVKIVGGGINFDPYNTSDTVSTSIGGVEYFGGSLSSDFGSFGSSYNVVVQSTFGGYNRPADPVSEVVLTIDSDVTPAVDGFTTFHNNLEILGSQDVTFDGAIKLAVTSGTGGASQSYFTIDFSELQGEAIGLIVDNFEQLGQGGGIYGNADNLGSAEVFISIEADEATVNGAPNNNYGFDDGTSGLVSQGVTQYTVLVIEGDADGGTATIRLCDSTEDLEVMALRGNWNDTLNVVDAAWGLVFELQGGSLAKADGPTGTANVGKLLANYEWPGADAVVNLVHSVAGDTRPIKAYGIDVNNASSLTVNSAEGSAIINSIEGDANTTSMTFTSTGSVTIGAAVVIDGAVTNADGTLVAAGASATDGLGTIDASGVDGNFTATLTGDSKVGGFDFIASAGTTTLTLDGVDLGAGSSLTADPAATFNLVVTAGTSLASATLTEVDQITIGNGLGGVGGALTLSIGQVLAIGAGNIVDDGNPGTGATLNIVNYAGEAFDANALGAGVEVGSVTTTSGVVVFDPTADFNLNGTNLDSPDLNIPEGATVTMTAAQFMAFDVITEIANGAITAATTINITGLTQADIDAGFSLAGLGNIVGTVALAEDVVLTGASGDTDLGPNLGSNFEFLLGTFNLGVASQNQADNLQVSGDAGSYVKFLFNDYDDGIDEDYVPTFPITGDSGYGIDVSGYDVPQILVSDLLVNSVPSNNVDSLLRGLQVGVEKVIFNDYVTQYDQVLTLQPGAVVRNDIIVADRVDDDIELSSFTLNLTGGNVIQGLSFSNQIPEDDDLLKLYLQTVTINSDGTTPNPLSGDPTNIIINGLSANNVGGPLFPGFNGNDLLNIIINATQDLDIQGTVAFNKVSNEDGIDRGDSPANLTVNGTADVNIGEIEADDGDINGVNVVNNGTGTLTVGVDGNNIDANDPLSFTGTGDIVLEIGNTVDLSDDDIPAVSQILVEDLATLTVTLDQAEAIGEANFVLADGDTANLNLVGLDNQVFILPAYDPDFVITVTLVDTEDDGVITLNPLTDLTGISGLVVPANTTLELTLAQFQQMSGDGSITGLGSVHITDVNQADADNGVGPQGEGLDLDGIQLTGANSTVTLSLSESVDLSEADLTFFGDPQVDVFNIFGFELTLGDIQVADGVDVNGTAGSILKFTDEVILALEDIDASGFNVDFLYVLNVAISANNIDDVFENLPADVIKVIYNDFGNVLAREQLIIVEPTVTIPAGIGANDSNPAVELTKLTIELQGGTEIGPWPGETVAISFLAQDSDDLPIFLQELNIISNGTEANLLSGETANIINGDISPIDVFGFPFNPPFPQRDNQLKLINVSGTQDLWVNGAVVFNVFGGDEGDPPEYQGDPVTDFPIYYEDDAEVVFNFDGSGGGDFTGENVDITDGDIDIFTLNANGPGVFTLTGGSPAIIVTQNPGSTQTVKIAGNATVNLGDYLTEDGLAPILGGDAGNKTAFGGDENDDALDASSLLGIDASAHTGALTIGEVVAIRETDFTFTSGTGVTNFWLADSELNNTNGPAVAGWSFDFSNAAAGSQFIIGDIDGGPPSDMEWTDGDLVINLGTNTTLLLLEDTDWSALDSVSINGTIQLGQDVDLVLTAAQADGLTIIQAPGTTGGSVTVTYLGDDEDDAGGYDLSGIDPSVAGFAYLADVGGTDMSNDDSTLDPTTDLGAFGIYLYARNNSDFNVVDGQTIRMTNQAQADGREIEVELDTDPDIIDTEINSSNVVWLFETIVGGPMDTSDYDSQIGRVIFPEQLLNSVGGNFEALASSLPLQILRVDFTDIADAFTASNLVNRIVEIANFETLSDISFLDDGTDPEEHIENLLFQLGGQTTIGNIVIDDAITTPPADPDTVMFNLLVFNSRVALDDDHFLAGDNYVNDNTAPTGEPGETVQPDAINTVGDVDAGTSPQIDLLRVHINTFGLASVGGGDQTLGQYTNTTGVGAWPWMSPGGAVGNDGAEFVAGTITLTDNGADNTVQEGEFKVSGANDVTIAALETSGPIVTVNEDYAQLLGAATVTFTGASPAHVLTGVQNLNIETGSELDITKAAADDAEIDVYYGYTLVGPDYVRTNAGINGNELSNLTVTGNGEIQLGILQLVDTTNDEFGAPGPAGDYAFQLDGNNEGAGETFATIGSADGVTVAMTLAADQVWNIKDASVILDDGLTFQTDSIVNFLQNAATSYVNLTIDGNVDMSKADVSWIGIDGKIVVNEGAVFTLTLAQVAAIETLGIEIVGPGTTKLVGDGTNHDPTTTDDALRTAIVDASAITIDLPTDTDDLFALTTKGALEADNVALLGQKLIGSVNDDVLTIDLSPGTSAADGFDYLFQGGKGDDTYNVLPRGGAEADGDFTYLVESGTDTISSLVGETGFSDAVGRNDVLIVSAGATANAFIYSHDGTSVGFYATAETSNAGTANIYEDADLGTVGQQGAGDLVVDLSLAQGPNGYTVVMATDDTVVGSLFDDSINGGNDKYNGSEYDTLTGKAGDDTFNFDVQRSIPATATVSYGPPVQSRGRDAEALDINGDGVGTGNLVINYTLQDTTANIITESVLLTDVEAMEDAIIDALNTLPGLTASESPTFGDVLVVGDDEVGFDFNLITAIGVGVTTPTYSIHEHTGTTDEEDLESIQFIDVDNEAATITLGEIYTAIVTLSDGTKIVAKTDGTQTDWDGVLNAIYNDFLLSPEVGAGLEIDIAINDTGGLGGDDQLVINDETIDNGGFTLEFLASGTISGTGASDLLGPPLDLGDWATADIITDFLSGDDQIHIEDLPAGLAGNYMEAATVGDGTQSTDVNFGTALLNANTAFAGNVGLHYYLTSISSTGVNDLGTNSTPDTGLLFFDANLDGNADGVIRLLGITSADFSSGDIA